MSRRGLSRAGLTSSTAERIKNQKEKILALWKSRITQDIPAASEQPESQLRDSIPKFLDRLANALSHEGLRVVSTEVVKEVSEEHAQQRASLKDYSLQEVLREFQVLREVLFSVLEQEGPLSPQERDTVLSAIEQGMTESGAHFVQQAQCRAAAIEDRFRLVVEGVKDHAILRIDPQGKILDWNTGAENIFQYKRDEILGKDARIIFVPEDLQKGAEEKERKIAEETGKAEDKRWHVKKDGSRFFANGILNSLRDSSGHLIGFVKVLRDETERIQYEEKLRLSNNFLEAVIAHLPVGVSITDARTGRALYYNSEVEDLTERAVSKRQSTKDLETYGAIHADGTPYKVEDYPTTRALTKGEVTRNEVMLYRRRDGSIATFNTNSVPIRDSQGSILASVTTVQDLTQSKKAEEALKKSEARFRTLLETVPHVVWFFNTNAEVEFISIQMERYTGLPTDKNAIGKTYANFLHPDDMQATLDAVVKAKENGGQISMVHRIRRFDGEYRWNLAVGNPVFDESGKILGWIGTTTDIHDQKLAEESLKQSEARFRILANALPQIIWTATADFQIDWYNDWWYQYLGLPRGTRWNDPDAQPMHPEDVEKTYPRLKEAVESGEDFVMEQRFRRGSDGQYRWHLVRGVPLRDSNGKITKWIGANTDIHDHKVLFQRLEEEQILRERFVATLSHDLRTPLTAAKINAQMLLRRANDPEFLYKTAVRISENIERSDRMIRDLLDVNQIRAGVRLPLDVSECDITNLVQTTVEELALVHGDRFTVKASESIVGYWSSGALKRILENLCNNAIKYGARDKTITVSLERKEPNEVRLSVHNWGNPIAIGDQESLFEPYRRTHSAQTGNEKGWGLGLTLVRGLVEAHGGRVKVESSAEKGTTFSVFLPLDARVHPVQN